MSPPLSEDESDKEVKVPRFKSFNAPRTETKSAPKFSSFKPAAPSSKPEASQEPSSRERHKSRRSEDDRHKRDRSSDRHRRRDERDGHRRQRSRDRDRESHKERNKERDPSKERHSRRHRRSRSRSRSPRSKKEDKIVLQSKQDPTILPWETEKLPYQVDTRGDPHNITYGTIHRYNIPNYWRHGKDRIVGLSRSAKIESDKGDGKGLVIGHTGGRGSGRTRGWQYATEQSRPLKVITEVDGQENAFVQGWNFVEFPQNSRKRKRDSEKDGTIGPDYRSIEGVPKGTEKNIDSDLEEASSSENEAGILDADTKERTIYLSRLVEAEPQNLQAWFSLVDHQEVVIYGNKEKHRRKVRQGERQALEEVKLGILEKAMTRNPGNSVLILRYMRLGTSIWDPSKVKSKWEDMLSRNGTMIELWEGYINFRQADFVSFKYQECLKVYEDCIQRLRGRILRFGVEEEERAKLEKILLYILTRATAYMDQAGYSEMSIAIWQGLLEMDSSAPKTFVSGSTSLTEYEEMLDSFGSFWDSEVLRIGDVKSKGWAAYVDEDIGEFSDPKDLPERISTNELHLGNPDFFGVWLDRETELLGKLPARTTDEIEEDDPFRVILFSDIRPFLWKFRAPSVRSSICDAFIAFTGIVAPTEYQKDSFFRTALAKTKARSLATWFWHDSNHTDVKLITWVDGAPMEPERRGRISKNPFMFRSNNIPASPESLFPSTWWFHGVELPNDGSEKLSYCIAMLKDYTLRVPDERLALVYFAVEFASTPTKNKKVAKQLLKSYSHSLRLWNAYAMSEMAQGNKDAAKMVYQTALKMSSGFTDDQQRFAIELWRSWIWNEVDEGNEDIAMNMLFALPDGHEAMSRETDRSATAILRVLRFLEERQSQTYSQQDLEIALAYAELRSLFLYLLAKERDTCIFLKPLDDLRNDLEGNINEHSIVEQLYMSKARLFYHYAATARPYKASAFREFLEPVIRGYPDNTAFLGLFVWNESRSKIEYRIRTILSTDVASKDEDDSIVKWSFAIWAEMQMSAGRMINPNGVRNIFEKAVECERTKSSIQLWVLYLHFEVRQAQPRRAKDVFFRAVRACPWSKDIILSGFKLLRSILEFADLRKIYGVMQEKELRIHVEIEDLLEDWDKEALGAGGHGRGQFIGSGIENRITLPDDGDSEIGD